MSVIENLAVALDSEGISVRVQDNILYVPLSSDVDIRLVETDPFFPAISIYIDDDVLVSVAFSLEDAVAAVLEHLATDDMVTCMRDLLEGTDGRLMDMEFIHDVNNPDQVYADVGNQSRIEVLFTLEHNTAFATVRFFTEDEFLDLGVYEDFDRLIEVLAFANDHAEEWEEELTPVVDY